MNGVDEQNDDALIRSFSLHSVLIVLQHRHTPPKYKARPFFFFFPIGDVNAVYTERKRLGSEWASIRHPFLRYVFCPFPRRFSEGGKGGQGGTRRDWRWGEGEVCQEDR